MQLAKIVVLAVVSCCEQLMVGEEFFAEKRKTHHC